MNIKDFYSFGSKLLSTTFQAHAENLTLDKSHNLILGVFDNIDFPVVFRQEYGKKLTDMLDTGFVSLFLISDKMLRVLKENKITGWKTYPVKVYDKKGNEVEDYHGFSITGRSGPINYDKSEIIEKQLAPEGPPSKYYKGRYFGYEKWDGSDFFIPEGTFYIIVTKKVVQAFKKAKLTNIRFECLTDIETMGIIVEQTLKNKKSIIKRLFGLGK